MYWMDWVLPKGFWLVPAWRAEEDDDDDDIVARRAAP